MYFSSHKKIPANIALLKMAVAKRTYFYVGLDVSTFLSSLLLCFGPDYKEISVAAPYISLGRSLVNSLSHEGQSADLSCEEFSIQYMGILG